MQQEKELIVTNRRKIITGLAATSGLLIAGCSSRELPPTYGNVLRMGDVLTYRAFRMLLPAHSLAREYTHSDITSSPAIGTWNPADPHQPLYNAERGVRYDRLRAGALAQWRLTVDGRVSRPGSFSLASSERCLHAPR